MWPHCLNLSLFMSPAQYPYPTRAGIITGANFCAYKPASFATKCASLFTCTASALPAPPAPTFTIHILTSTPTPSSHARTITLTFSVRPSPLVPRPQSHVPASPSRPPASPKLPPRRLHSRHRRRRRALGGCRHGTRAHHVHEHRLRPRARVSMEDGCGQRR